MSSKDKKKYTNILKIYLKKIIKYNVGNSNICYKSMYLSGKFRRDIKIFFK